MAMEWASLGSFLLERLRDVEHLLALGHELLG
jgi:hypothetical protein